MRRFTCLFLLIGLFSFEKWAVAQHDIEPRLLYADTSSFAFSSEWQYLSTDIYLLDPTRFANVINEMEFYAPKKNFWGRKTRKKNEKLEYLFITASLKNAKFLGESEVTYPLYNFRVQAEQGARYQMLTSDNIDHVRILDNLPLYTANDQIDAQIGVHAITNSSQNLILNLVAKQLKNISKILTPSAAVMSLVSEFGSLLEANTKSKEYHFSSTIRLFEQKNFDTRVHSIKIYSLESSASRRDAFDSTASVRFLDTVGVGRQTRATIRSLVRPRQYPTVVVVNYKSLYKMEPVSGDEVNSSNIERRRLKVENDYRQGLINIDTYRQERDFLSFLNIFATFKNHLDVYKLNNRTGNTDAIGGSLFSLMQQYRALRKAYREMSYKYKDNKTFSTVFKPEYEAVLGYAMLYMDDDHNLKSTKQLVDVLLRLENTNDKLTTKDLEAAIAILHFSGQYKREMMLSQPEGQEIRDAIDRLEEDLYKRTYAGEVERLSRVNASVVNRNAAQRLLTLVRNTSCAKCRDRAIEAINAFGERMDSVYLIAHKHRLDSVRVNLSPWVYLRIDSLSMLQKRYDATLATETSSEVSRFVGTKLRDLEQDLASLRDLLTVSLEGKGLSQVKLMMERLQVYRKRVEDGVYVICKMAPALCSPEPSAPKEEEGNPPEAYEVTQPDSVEVEPVTPLTDSVRSAMPVEE